MHWRRRVKHNVLNKCTTFVIYYILVVIARLSLQHTHHCLRLEKHIQCLSLTNSNDVVTFNMNEAAYAVHTTACMVIRAVVEANSWLIGITKFWHPCSCKSILMKPAISNYGGYDLTRQSRWCYFYHNSNSCLLVKLAQFSRVTTPAEAGSPASKYCGLTEHVFMGRMSPTNSIKAMNAVRKRTAIN